jgi:hypothetical protein
MKIAVYGDSFASYELNTPNNGRGLCWVDLVKENHKVTNFGIPGSSIFHSYKLFLENFEFFDYNIFIITHPSRIYNSKLDKLFPTNEGSWYTNYENVRVCELLLKRSKSFEDEKKLKIVGGIKFYYEEWQDDEYESILNISLIEKMKREFKNTLFIDAFSKKFSPWYDILIGLIDISIWEQEQVGFIEKYGSKGIHWGYIDYKTKKYFVDNRLNHLSEENNIVLGLKILEGIKNRETYLNLNIEDFKTPRHDIDFYVRWKPI